MINLHDDESNWDTAGHRSQERYKGPAINYNCCPTCKKTLLASEIEISFDKAPIATRTQKVRGFVCAEGHKWPDPAIMREAHTKAFTTVNLINEIENQRDPPQTTN